MPNPLRALRTAPIWLALAGCDATGATPDDLVLSAQNRPLPVLVATVTAADGYRQTHTYTGTVKARQTTDLAFLLGGKIDALLVDVGAAFEQGQILARLDQRRLAARQLGIAARLHQAEAVLAEMRAGPRQEVIATARAETRRLTKEGELAALQLERKRKLLRDAAASQADVDIAQTRMETMREQLAGARSSLAELEAGTRRERVDAQLALVRSLQAERQQIGIEIEDSSLRAPFAGVTAARHFDIGAVVDIGQPVFRLVEAAQLEAWIGVPTTALPRLTNNKTSRLQIAGQEFALTQARVLPELDRLTRTATVVFDLPKDAASIRPGELVRLQLDERIASAGFSLPLSALTESRRGLWSCYVLDTAPPGSAKGSYLIARAEIEVLHSTVERAFVRGTLKSGDQVLVAGTQRVVPGQLVTPTWAK